MSNPNGLTLCGHELNFVLEWCSWLVGVVYYGAFGDLAGVATPQAIRLTIDDKATISLQ